MNGKLLLSQILVPVTHQPSLWGEVAILIALFSGIALMVVWKELNLYACHKYLRRVMSLYFQEAYDLRLSYPNHRDLSTSLSLYGFAVVIEEITIHIHYF